MKELKTNSTYNSLAGQVALNRQQTERMATVVERERTMAAAVTRLDQDITAEKAAHQIAMQEQKQTIARLKEELQTIKSATTIDGRFGP
jgi:outer membrane murein-binding lipoprotein Lpp